MRTIKRRMVVEEEEEENRKSGLVGPHIGWSRRLLPEFCRENYMAGQSRKWMILMATIWIQAFTGTNFDFSAYSSTMKSVMGISQVQLNYLATASDLGKAFGWSSGLALMYLPLSVVLFMAAFMGLVGYGLQWLVIQNFVSLPYFVVFLLCLLAGCSICWFNTVCFVLCVRNFPTNRALALSLTIGFNGVSPPLYTLLANSFTSTECSLYLVLNAVVPLVISIVALVPILRQPPLEPLSPDATRRDSLVFLVLYFLAVVTGLYLLFLSPIASIPLIARSLFAGAIFLLCLPLGIPGITYARGWARRTIHDSFRIEGSGFNLVDVDDLELHKELLGREDSFYHVSGNGTIPNGNARHEGADGCCENVMGKDRLVMLGEEHRLICWCGDGTSGYTTLLTSAAAQLALCTAIILGRLRSPLALVQASRRCLRSTPLVPSSADLFLPCQISKVYFARTGWLAAALVPTPMAFFLLASSGSWMSLHTSTALIGLSSGFIFAAAASITSELFGPNSIGVNHNILITNIPLGSLLYGLLAAVVYDNSATSSPRNPVLVVDGAMVCMGRKCYLETFVWWGCISVVGLAASVLLFVRTRRAYDRFEHNRITA
ncbi:hypothetical protein Sjap_004011 [Stephania japonica]|uniref:Nodulin-like domain-containing protein n=1 Tax=Stephania japonica TaxID=461633 RepID=A0AAP0K300_9MAGN